MSSHTMVFGIEARRSEKWRVYRIRTENSAYELEVQAAQANGERRCAVLTCVEPAERAGEAFEDSNPMIGGRSLFDASPMDWMGERLEVGTARTSEIRSVDFIEVASERRAPRRQQPRSEALPPPQWSPFPAGLVEMAEAAGSVLKAISHRPDLHRAIEGQPMLQRRLALALAECRLMLDVIEKEGG